MPDYNSNLTATRAGGHKAQVYLSVLKGRSLCTGEIDGSNFSAETGRYSQLSITNTTGTFNVSLYDCEIEFFDGTSGKSKGRTRISRETVPSSSTISIPETALANLDINVADTFIIYDEHRIRTRIPSEDLTFSPDNQTYVSQTANLPPIVCSGGVKAAWVDSGESYATIAFDGSNSRSNDDDSNDGNLTHYWYFGSDCTPEDSTSESPSVQIPVGARWVYHAVTDTGASNSIQYQWIPVAVHNASNRPYRVILNPLAGNPQSGWNCDFTFEDGQDVDKSTIPDGCAVVLWVDEDRASYGAVSGQASVKFFGYLSEDNENKSADNNRVQMSAVSPLTKAQELTGFGVVMEDSTSPSNWQEIEGLTVNKAINHLLSNYSTLLSVCDFLAPDYDIAYPAFYEQKQTPLAQARELALAQDSRITMDRRGMLLKHVEPDLLPLSLRSSQVNTLTLTETDIITLDVNRTHDKVVDTIELRGIIAGTLEPVFSIYPSTAPNGGQFSEIADRLIVNDQTDLNERAGRRGARIDRVFINADGEQYRTPIVNARLRGSYDLFDFYDEYTKFNLANDTLRQAELDVFLFYVTSISISYVDGTAVTNVTWQAASNAPAGQPLDKPAPNPEYIPPETITTTPINVVPIGQTDNVDEADMAIILSDGKVLRTSDGDTVSPTWSEEADLGASVGTVKAFADDVQNNGTCWIVGGADASHDVFKLTNLLSGTPAAGSSLRTIEGTPKGRFKIAYNPKRSPVIATVLTEETTGTTSITFDFVANGQTDLDAIADLPNYDAGNSNNDGEITTGFTGLVSGPVTYDAIIDIYFDPAITLNTVSALVGVKTKYSITSNVCAVGVSAADDGSLEFLDATANGQAAGDDIVSLDFTPSGQTCTWIRVIARGGDPGSGTTPGQIKSISINYDSATPISGGTKLTYSANRTSWSTVENFDYEGLSPIGIGSAVAFDQTFYLGGAGVSDSGLIRYLTSPSYNNDNTYASTDIASANILLNVDSYEDIVIPALVTDRTPVYIVYYNGTDSKRYLLRAYKSGVYTDITPTLSGVKGNMDLAGSVYVSKTNPNVIMAVGVEFDSSKRCAFLSKDKGNTWKQISLLETNTYRYGAIHGSKIFLWGDNGKVAYSPDLGVNLYDKRGDMVGSYTQTIIGLVVADA